MDRPQEEKGLSLVGKDVMPTTLGERNMSATTFFVVWFTMAIQLVTFILAAQMYPAFSPMQILLACIIGNSLTVLVLVLTGDIGIRYGIQFAVYARVCFGYLGTHIPAIFRVLIGMFWFGFQTWFGAYAINTILEITTGYSNLNLLIILFGAVQIVTVMYGIKGISWFEWIAAPAILVIGLYLLSLVLRMHNTTLIEVMRTPGKGGMSFFYAITSQMAVYIPMSLTIMDFTRYLKSPDSLKHSWFKTNAGSIIAQFAGLVSAMLLFTLIGMVSGVLTGNWNPIDVIVETMDKPAILFVCLLFIIFAQWSTNIAANLFPPVNIIINFFPRKIDIKIAAIVTGVVALILRPWLLADQTQFIMTSIGALMGPVAGVMVCDYYILRRRKINLREIYRVNGQYRYAGNFNPAALIAYVPAAIIAYLWPTYGFLWAFGLSIILYYPLMKYWIVLQYPQPEITDPNFKLDVSYALLDK